MSLNYGWVYCMSNPSMSGLLKVGMTDRTPEIRAAELFKTGVPTPFKIEFSKKVVNPLQKETTLHNLLSKERINPRREFFCVSLEKVKELFNLMDGDVWVGEVSERVLEEEVLKNKKKTKKQIKKEDISKRRRKIELFKEKIKNEDWIIKSKTVASGKQQGQVLKSYKPPSPYKGKFLGLQKAMDWYDIH